MAKRITIKGPVKDAITRDLAQAFAALGHKAALDAYKQKGFNHRTYNLHDSYGSAVYINGILVDDSIRYVNRVRSRRIDTHGRNQGGKTGRDALMNFFRTGWLVRKRDSFTVVVAAAMWYAKIVESHGIVVLDWGVVKESYAKNFDKFVGPVLKKYGIEKLAPALRRGIGVDMEYYRENR